MSRTSKALKHVEKMIKLHHEKTMLLEELHNLLSMNALQDERAAENRVVSMSEFDQCVAHAARVRKGIRENVEKENEGKINKYKHVGHNHNIRSQDKNGNKW